MSDRSDTKRVNFQDHPTLSSIPTPTLDLPLNRKRSSILVTTGKYNHDHALDSEHHRRIYDDSVAGHLNEQQRKSVVILDPKLSAEQDGKI